MKSKQVKKNWILGIVALVLAVISWQAVIGWAASKEDSSEQYNQMRRSTLRGLQGVQLFVYGLKEDIEKYGLLKSQIITDVESKLRGAGIKILTAEERFETPGAPVLYVWAGVLKKPDIDLFNASFRVELQQHAVLKRDPSILCNAITWHAWSVGLLVSSKDLQLVRKVINDHIDVFINDYLAANPKETTNHLKD